jgi:hypothetical protein
MKADDLIHTGKAVASLLVMCAFESAAAIKNRVRENHMARRPGLPTVQVHCIHKINQEEFPKLQE